MQTWNVQGTRGHFLKSDTGCPLYRVGFAGYPVALSTRAHASPHVHGSRGYSAAIGKVVLVGIGKVPGREVGSGRSERLIIFVSHLVRLRLGRRLLRG